MEDNALCDDLKKKMSINIEEAFERSEQNLGYLKEYLKEEIDKVTQHIEALEKCLSQISKNAKYFLLLLQISEEISECRKEIGDHDPSNSISNLLNEEKIVLSKAQSDMMLCDAEVDGWLKKLLEARNNLLVDTKINTETLNVNELSQHGEPLHSDELIPNVNQPDQRFCPSRNETGSDIIKNKIESAQTMRCQSTQCCAHVQEVIKNNLCFVEKAWCETSKLLEETMENDENKLRSLKAEIEHIHKNILKVEQNIALSENELNSLKLNSNAEKWKREVSGDHTVVNDIQSGLSKTLEGENDILEENINRITTSLEKYKGIMQKITQEEVQLSSALDQLSKKIFIEKDKCLSMRKPILLV